MKKILISGGNSGIGLESARQLTALGHYVVLLGRDASKGAAALAELKRNPGQSEFLAVDVSTHSGVQAAAEKLLAAHERFDVLLHTSGVLIMEDARTADGLHPFFAVNYLSRYHLTQLLLPALRKSTSPRVILMTSKLKADTKIDFNQFPYFKQYNFRRMTASMQFGNQHYVAHLRDTEPRVLAAAVNAGVARTGIWRKTPLAVRLLAATVGRFFFNSVSTSARNPVALCVEDGWASGSYLEKPGKPDQITPLRLDGQETQQVIAVSHELTGA